MSQEGIVEFGKRVFGDYYSKKISLKRLLKLIDEREASNNDYAVLGCYCEKDEEVTYQLHRLENRKSAKSYHKEFIEDPNMVKIISMIVMTELENSAVPLDKYFKCDRFAKMLIKEFKKAWGKNYHHLFNKIEEKVKHFNFPSWNHNFETYVLSCSTKKN